MCWKRTGESPCPGLQGSLSARRWHATGVLFTSRWTFMPPLCYSGRIGVFLPLCACAMAGIFRFITAPGMFYMRPLDVVHNFIRLPTLGGRLHTSHKFASQPPWRRLTTVLVPAWQRSVTVLQAYDTRRGSLIGKPRLVMHGLLRPYSRSITTAACA